MRTIETMLHTTAVVVLLTSAAWSVLVQSLGDASKHRHRDEIQQLEQRLETCEGKDLPRLLRAEERRLNEREANFR